MEKNLIASLLRVYHSDQPRQSASGVLTGLVIAHWRLLQEAIATRLREGVAARIFLDGEIA